MNKKENEQEKIIFLLVKSLLPFLSGTLMAFILLHLAEVVNNSWLNIIYKFFGYSIYCYLVTPFILYWLGYASVTRLTKETIIMTICLVGLYSLVLWDSYFFFKHTMQLLFVCDPFSTKEVINTSWY